MHLLFTTEKVHSQKIFTFLHLTPDSVDGIFQNSEGVDSSIKIHNLTAHSNKHCSKKDPHFLLHLLCLHQRNMKVNLLKLKRPFRTALTLHWASITGNFRMNLLGYFVSKVVKRSLTAVQADVLIPPERINLSLEFLDLILKISYSSLSV